MVVCSIEKCTPIFYGVVVVGDVGRAILPSPTSSKQSLMMAMHRLLSGMIWKGCSSSTPISSIPRST